MISVESLQRLISHDAAFTKAYEFVVRAAGEGTCTLEVPHLPHFERPGGIAAGQVFVTAADVAMWLAIKTLRGLDDASVTTHMQTEFLKAARGEGFVCTAKVLKLGKRKTFGTAECVSASGDLLAYHTLTYVIPTGDRAQGTGDR